MKTYNATRGDRRPFFKHDSEDNYYLGSQVSVHSDGSASVEDVWLEGDRLDDAAGLIIRTSSDGPDYTSFPVRIVRNIASGGGAGNTGFEHWVHALLLLDMFYSAVRGRRFNGVTPPNVAAWLTVVRQSHIEDKDQDSGGSYTTFLVVEPTPYLLTSTLTERARIQQIADLFPHTFCQHSHDCCGQYYADHAKIVRLSNGRYLVRQRFTQNV